MLTALQISFSRSLKSLLDESEYSSFQTGTNITILMENFLAIGSGMENVTSCIFDLFAFIVLLIKRQIAKDYPKMLQTHVLHFKMCKETAKTIRQNVGIVIGDSADETRLYHVILN